MTRQGKWKVRVLEKALDGVRAEDRPGLAAEIERMFEDFDPANPPGEPVVPIAPGTRVCPTCGGALVEVAAIPGSAPACPRLCVLECEDCDTCFCEPIEHDIQ